MKIIELDCLAISDRATFHSVLANALCFPSWYGANLDALHDCLTDICEDTCLRLLHWTKMPYSSEMFPIAVRRVMEHAAKENPHLQIEFL